jgi:hypothetical protein
VAVLRLQRLVRLDLRVPREIQDRRDKTETATGTKTVTETATEMQPGQARLRHVQQDSTLPRTTTADRFASETNDVVWSRL